MKNGLKPTPITRDPTWGVQVRVQDGDDDHGMKEKVLCKCDFLISGRFLSLFPPALDFWVPTFPTAIQFAPLGYPSLTANCTPECENWRFNPENVKRYQFLSIVYDRYALILLYHDIC